ncbi:M20/M25/M40 family metallo-hydrolase [Paenarthrobacter sp. NPDC090517]|uniref:M20/M25/M40 family metallo-hydrolase n=1 Tax=Paenarthrobacter sp. NPDC090517 TaxID=3364381 RepID=UPI0038299ECA
MTLQQKLPRPAVDAIAAAVDWNMASCIEALMDLVKIPGVAWPGFDREPLELSAAHVRELFLEAGFPDARIVRGFGDGGVPGAPAVLAQRPAAPGFPTVLLYAHHDVQPAGPNEAWWTPPFVPVERGDRLFGRGVADNKAGIIMHLAAVKAMDAVLGSGHGLGLCIFIEGEEEAGSPTLAGIFEDQGSELRAQAAIVADSGSWGVGTPALTTSLRGLVDGIIRVRVLDRALHSGTYGGPVLDALTVLAKLMASFHDDDGAVAVEGLVSTSGNGLDMDQDVFRHDAGVLAGVELAGNGSLTSRLWTKLALSFVGLDAQPIATAGNVLLPEASVKFSLRLPPGSDPNQAMEAVRRHAAQHTPFGAEVTFSPGTRSKPFTVAPDDPMIQSALWSLETAWGARAVKMGVGGSIPFAAALAEQQPDCSILITGAEDPDSRAHGANESVHLGELRNAILAEALFLAQLHVRFF